MHAPFLREAIELGAQSIAQPGGGPFGAVIAQGRRRVAGAANQVVQRADPTAHAEVMAIRAACEVLGTHVLSGHQLYTSCEPCPMCLAAAHWARVDAIYYAASRKDAAAIGFDDEWLYVEVALPVAERRITTGQALQAEAQQMMAAWGSVPSERHY